MISGWLLDMVRIGYETLTNQLIQTTNNKQQSRDVGFRYLNPTYNLFYFCCIHYQLSTINYQLSTINYQLSTINYQLILMLQQLF